MDEGVHALDKLVALEASAAAAAAAASAAHKPSTAQRADPYAMLSALKPAAPPTLSVEPAEQPRARRSSYGASPRGDHVSSYGDAEQQSPRLARAQPGLSRVQQQPPPGLSQQPPSPGLSRVQQQPPSPGLSRVQQQPPSPRLPPSPRGPLPPSPGVSRTQRPPSPRTEPPPSPAERPSSPQLHQLPSPYSLVHPALRVQVLPTSDVSTSNTASPQPGALPPTPQYASPGPSQPVVDFVYPPAPESQHAGDTVYPQQTPSNDPLPPQQPAWTSYGPAPSWTAPMAPVQQPVDALTTSYPIGVGSFQYPEPPPPASPHQEPPRHSSLQQTAAHSFAAVTALTPIVCGACGRARTSIKAFQCAGCGLTVHRHCVSLADGPCSTTLKTSQAPVAFQSLVAKHRGLRPVNLLAVQWEGSLWKLSSNGVWKTRFFILPSGDSATHLFYFSAKPTVDARSEAIPSGGIPLQNASVAPVEWGDRQHCLALSGPQLDRTMVLAASDDAERSACLQAVAAAIAFNTASGFGVVGAVGPWQNNWDLLPTVTRRVLCVSEETLLDCERHERARCFAETTCIDADQLPEGVGLFARIESIEQLPPPARDGAKYFGIVRAFYAGRSVGREPSTDAQTEAAFATTEQPWLLVASTLSALPAETMLLFSLYCVVPAEAKGLERLFKHGDVDGDTSCVGHVHVPLTDLGGRVRSGVLELRLAEGEGSPIHWSFSSARTDAPLMRVRLPENAPMPVVYTSFPLDALLHPLDARPGAERVDLLFRDEQALPNPLLLVPAAKRQQMWQARDSLPHSSLPQVLSGCECCEPAQRRQLAAFCAALPVADIPGSTALHLLGSEFAAAPIRMLATRVLCSVGDSDLALIALMLSCAVRYEVWDWSPLADALVERAASNPELVHSFFWAAYGQSSPPQLPLARRFTRLVRALLRAATAYPCNRDLDLLADAIWMDRLTAVAADDERRRDLASLLRPQERLNAPRTLPTSVHHVVQGVDVEHCKTLSSNAAPLLMRFTCVDTMPAMIIKAGDDLRQDELCLLMGALMQRIWDHAKLPARLRSYRVMTTGLRRGLIEVVPGCSSLSKVQGGVTGAFRVSVLTEWFAANKPPSLSWDELVANFSLSLSASCVFEHVLGIADRHADNLLVQPDGTVFHIDFGYFMGNKTKFAGINRETQPFTLTPAMVDVLGGRQSAAFERFADNLCSLYLCVRSRHVLFTGLAMMALASKMPHLKRVEDVYYMRDALAPELSVPEAAAAFRKLIDAAIDTKRVAMNDAVHNLVGKLKSKK